MQAVTLRSLETYNKCNYLNKMKSLIILKGLAKTKKLKWVEKEGLQNFFLDIDTIKKLYSVPELVTPFKDILSKSFGDTVYSEFRKLLTIRLSKGNLIVIDPEDENLVSLEKLAFIFGYTVFYVVQGIPQDYLTKSSRYRLPYYPHKKKEELKKEVVNFMSLQFKDKLVINTYKDVEDYWEKTCKRSGNYLKLGKRSKPVLHISDIHSNWKIYKKLPRMKKFSIRIFYGDYIDGPEQGGSRRMIDEIIESKNPCNIWLEGNHELRLRKHLGLIMLGTGGKNKELRDILYKSLPDDYIRTTYTEFSDLTPGKAREYLMKLNEKLKLFIIIENNNVVYICTHSGLKYIEQISPKYIGSVIYGSRDINRVDRDFSSHTKNTKYWSIHAHCKYYDKWCAHKYRNVVNLDPRSNEEIIYAEQNKNNWKICQIESN